MCFVLRKHKLCNLLVMAWNCTVIMSNRQIHGNLTNKLTEYKKYFNLNFTTSSNINTSYRCVADVQKEWFEKFNFNRIPEPDLSIKYIIQHVLNIKEQYKYDLSLKKEVTPEQEEQIIRLCECRLARMPIQYIIKEWDFRDLKLVMRPPVFIPRPETEQLVDVILEKVPTDASFLEVGCGSGAICLSLLKALPHARVTAVDQSSAACQLTSHNAQVNHLTQNLQVVHSKLQDDGSFSKSIECSLPVDVLVSNPPYVPNAQLADLQPEIKLYEDLRALEAGRDGLRVVKAMFSMAQTALKSGGLIFLEVDSSHPKLIEKWLAEHPECNIRFVSSYKDFCDKDRFVELKKL